MIGTFNSTNEALPNHLNVHLLVELTEARVGWPSDGLKFFSVRDCDGIAMDREVMNYSSTSSRETTQRDLVAPSSQRECKLSRRVRGEN